MVRCFCIAIILGTLSCESENPTAVDDRRFFPIAINNEWTYSYIETSYSVSKEPEINEFLYREKISTLLDEPNSIYKLDRSIKRKNANSWSSLSPILIKINPNRITLIDNNSEKDLLIFPLRNGNTWSNDQQMFSVFDQLDHFEMNKNQVAIQVYNDSTAIDLRRNFQVYEYGIGMVYALDVDFEYCQENAACIGKGIISSGTSKTFQLIESKINE